jgi:hypothetical protein
MLNGKLRVFFLAGLIFVCSRQAQGVIFHNIDTTRPLQCAFSKQHQNRIAVKDGRVKKVIAPESIFSVHLENESGQLFVYSLDEFDGRVTLSVITDSGSVQDLEIWLEEKSAEVVILKEPSPLDLEDASYGRKGSEKAVSLLKAFSRKEVPPDYIQRSSKNIRQRKYQDEHVFVRAVDLFEGPYERICVFELVNKGTQKVVLKEGSFKAVGDSWIFIDKHELQPKERTAVFVSEVKE